MNGENDVEEGVLLTSGMEEDAIVVKGPNGLCASNL